MKLAKLHQCVDQSPFFSLVDERESLNPYFSKGAYCSMKIEQRILNVEKGICDSLESMHSSKVYTDKNARDIVRLAATLYTERLHWSFASMPYDLSESVNKLSCKAVWSLQRSICEFEASVKQR